MKQILLPFFCAVALASTAQTSNVIEIAVDETIELIPQKVVLYIKVYSDDEQREQNSYGYFDYVDYSDEYDEEYYDYGADWEYQEMLENSPKKITKEMKKEYEERQKIREELDKKEAEREAERERKRAEFKPITLEQVTEKIKDLSIEFEVIKNSSGSISSEYDDYYDEYNEYMDDFIEVTVKNEDEWNKLKVAMKDMPIDEKLKDVEYESSTEKFEKVIPLLTEKARSQATLLANSMNRKLGKIIGCTNIYPFTPSKTYLSSFSDSFNDLMSIGADKDRPFHSNKTEIVQYIYRFELLN